MLPPVAEPADRSAAAVAQHQVALLRHEIRHVPPLHTTLPALLTLLPRSRSTILSKFAAHVLLPEAAPQESQVEHQSSDVTV